jgi:DNA invertase Pin-like site-specific DNA recombinase
MNLSRQKPDRVRYAIYARTAAGGPEEIASQVQAARATIVLEHSRENAAIEEHIDLNLAAGHGVPAPGLTALLRGAVAGRFEIVVVKDLARLSRSSARLSEIRSAIEGGGTRITCVSTEGEGE